MGLVRQELGINLTSELNGINSQLKEISINIKSFGVTGEGINDDTVAIQNAIDYVKSLGGGTVYFPKGRYKVNTHLILRNKVNLEGSLNNAVIFIDNDGIGNGEAWIYSENSSWNYNASTAPSFTIRGITFEYLRTKDCSDMKLRQMLGLFNVQNVTIEYCYFRVPNPVDNPLAYCGASCLDLYGNWRNVKILHCKFDLLSDSFIDGGCIWVRNFSNDVGSFSENVLIDDCIFNKKSHDEILAIYTCKENIRNIKIRNCIFNQLKSTTVSPVTFTFKAMGDGDICQDIEFCNNTITVDDVSLAVVHIGGGTGSTRDIKMHHNTWNVNTTFDPSVNTTYIVWKDINSSDTYFETNVVNVNATYYFKHGVKGVENVYNNTIRGKVQSIFTLANTCRDNIINVDTSVPNSVGLTNCRSTYGNKITNVCRGILLQYENGSTNQSYNAYNEISVTNDASARGAYLQVFVGRTFSADVQFVNNIFTVPNTNSYCIHMDNTNWNVILKDNKIIGCSKVYRPTGTTTFKYCSNNDWNTFNDSKTANISNSDGYSLLDALPVGHEIRNSAEGTPSKWIRTSSVNKNVSDWTIITGS